MSTAAKSKIGVAEGVPMAIGSILGSGILFLPSFTYSLAGQGVLISWVAVTLLCLLLVKIFFDMASETKGEGALGGFLSLGLSRRISNGLPILLLGTVCLGMPSSAYIVGLYTNAVFPNIPVLFAAFSLISIAVVANLIGLKTANWLQVGSIVLVVGLSIGLAVYALSGHSVSSEVDFSKIPARGVFQGIAAAFWAYAGFENLSFAVQNFKNPRRDFLISMIVALLITGAVYMLVTFSFMLINDETESESLTSLLSLAVKSSDNDVLRVAIALLAYSAVMLNFIAWIWGMSKMVGDAAGDGLLPSLFRPRGSSYKIPTIFLGVIFICVVSILATNPNWVEPILVAVSINFVFVYVLLLTSYLFWRRNLISFFISGLLLTALLPAIASFGWVSIYPILLLTVGVFGPIFIFFKRGQNEKSGN